MIKEGKRFGGLKGLGLIGSIIGFAGTLLDFYSGYMILTGSGMMTNGMGMASQRNNAGLVWGIGILLLGVVLAVTALAIVPGRGAPPMKDVGALMVVYGIVMLFIGGSMILKFAPMAQGMFLPGSAMVIVGVLMVVNGSVMRQTRMV